MPIKDTKRYKTGKRPPNQLHVGVEPSFGMTPRGKQPLSQIAEIARALTQMEMRTAKTGDAVASRSLAFHAIWRVSPAPPSAMRMRKRNFINQSEGQAQAHSALDLLLASTGPIQCEKKLIINSAR